MNHIELKHFFESRIAEYSKLASRINSLKERLNEVKKMPDDSLIQINMSTTVFSVSKETAIGIINDQIEVEKAYGILMKRRFMRAVAIINGEEY